MLLSCLKKKTSTAPLSPLRLNVSISTRCRMLSRKTPTYCVRLRSRDSPTHSFTQTKSPAPGTQGVTVLSDQFCFEDVLDAYIYFSLIPNFP